MDEALAEKWHNARKRIQAMRAAMNECRWFAERESLAVEVEKEEDRFRRSLSREEVHQLEERLSQLQTVPESSRQLDPDDAAKSCDPKDNDEFYLLRRLLRGV